MKWKKQKEKKTVQSDSEKRQADGADIYCEKCGIWLDR